MNIRTATIALTICFVALAGCNEKNPDAPPGNTTQTSTSTGSSSTTGQGQPPCTQNCPVEPLGHTIDLLDCTNYFLRVYADGAKLQERLPEGYDTGNDPGIALAGNICKTAVLDNNTVYGDVRWYSNARGVEVPTEVDDASQSNSYAFEVCFDEAALVEVMRQAGLEVCDGSLTADLEGPEISIQFTQNGGTVYDYHAVGAADQPDVGGDYSVRFHQASETHRTWFVLTGHASTPRFPGEEGTLEITGGLLAETMLHPGTTTLGDAFERGIGTEDTRMQFPSAPIQVTL